MPNEEVRVAKSLDKTLTKGMQILEYLATAPLARGITEIAAATNLSKPNVHRLTSTLSSLGYVRQEPDRRYRCTMKVWRLGNAVIGNVNLAHLAASAMRALAIRSGETVHLSVLDGLQALHIEEIESEQEIRIHTQRGANSPLHCVAAGKILLAFNYEAMRPAVEARLDRFTARTITSLRKLDAEMLRVRADGLAFNAGEFQENVGGIAAPVIDPAGNVIAAIGLSAPIARLGKGAMLKLAPAVKEAGRMVTEALAGGERVYAIAQPRSGRRKEPEST